MVIMQQELGSIIRKKLQSRYSKGQKEAPSLKPGTAQETTNGKSLNHSTRKMKFQADQTYGDNATGSII